MNEKKRKRLAKVASQHQSSKTYKPIERDKLGAFVNGHVAAMLETTNGDWFGDGQPFNKRFTKHTISERTLAQSIRDCLQFYWRYRAILEMLYSTTELGEYDAGYRFWKSRNHHKGGFDDNDSWDKAWDILHNGSIGFGPKHLTERNGEVDAYYAPSGS